MINIMYQCAKILLLLLVFYIIIFIYYLNSQLTSIDESYIYTTTRNRLSKISNILIKSNYCGNEENISFIDLVKKNSSDELLLIDARGNPFMINTAESRIFTNILIRGELIIMEARYIEVDMKESIDYQNKLFESGVLKRKP